MPKPICVTCIKCHDADQTVTLDLDGGGLFRCLGCDEEFEASDVREYLEEQSAAWGRILKWVDEYPCESDTDAASQTKVA